MSGARPGVYLAGFDVFLPDAAAHGERLKALAARHGFDGLFPLDNQTPPGLAGAALAQWIYRANVAMIQRADLVMANLNPFRGAEPDSGTAFEVGYAIACGKPVWAYTEQADSLIAQVAVGTADTPARAIDAQGYTVEDFGLNLNLMLACSARVVIGDAADCLARMAAERADGPRAERSARPHLRWRWRMRGSVLAGSCEAASLCASLSRGAAGSILLPGVQGWWHGTSAAMPTLPDQRPRRGPGPGRSVPPVVVRAAWSRWRPTSEEHIHGAAGIGRFDAGQAAQRVGQQRAGSRQLRAQRRHRGLAVFQGRRRRPLHGIEDAGTVVFDQLGQIVRQRRGHDHPADAPSGHGPGLGETVDRDDAVIGRAVPEEGRR